MYCSNCGSEMAGTRCGVCGRSLPANANGNIDATTGLMLAGWWRRVGATISDGLIVLMPTLLILSTFNSSKEVGLAVLCVLVVNGLYTIPLLSGVNGQTVGNRVASSRVRSAATGTRVTVEQVARRWAFLMFFGALGVLGIALFYVGVVVLLVDYLLPLFDPRNQTLHDKFAGTIVVIA